MIGSGGRYYGRVWYFRDITESNRTEKQLALLAHTLKSVVECVSVTDLHDTIIFVNNAFLKKYSYTEHEIVGKNVNVLRSPKNLPEAIREILPATLRGGWSGELLNRAKDGRDFMISLSTSFVRDEQGQIVALVGVATDISERKESENAKKLLEAQLQQAQKLESIGTLASGIAHDFNNILGIILGYSTILERLSEDPKALSESVAAIKKAIQRGALLVKQLLIFARKTDALFETVSINDIVVEINNFLQGTFPKTITLSMKLQRDLPTIVADSNQIHQVLLNLCLNARDAMPKNGTLAITTKTVEGGDVESRFKKATARQYVQIEVADTGIGMDEATRQRIFEPFFTTKSPGKGTGLGLAVVFGIVEHHGGFIDVRSVPHQGTSFMVYLPIAERALEELQAARKSIEEIPGGTEGILIIEDEETLRELLKASLVSKGYSVLTAEDGVQGVEMYERHQKTIAVVLSDMGLPLLGGQDVFSRIRKINPEAKVVIASGYLEPETKARMYGAGLKGFIPKPYLNDEVLLKIREVIDTKE
jgi:PAS domain S-box-containing protein